ncbi:peroxisome assembly protein 26 [Nelusetta ayraudi]|uniref:peroxisome assembly protein 26 n=1 Tax=Nelusetta ayraudi TaxID=303726 RepID=UPI003F71E049
MSSCSSSLPAPRSLLGSTYSPSVTQLSSMLDAAAEQMMIHKDFRAAFDACDSGLESLAGLDEEEHSFGELKAGFCILGIQALAEMNEWPAVLPWVLQQYEQERIPAKLMQMCILLYSKVGEPEMVQETARVWLHCPLNSEATGFRTVAELYLLHVLVPLGHKDEAVELIVGEVGSCAFTEDQRQTALDVVEEKERRNREANEDPVTSPNTEATSPPQGAVMHRLEAMLKFIYRKVLLTSSSVFTLRRITLAAVLLYMLLLRLDPAFPTSFMWISKLLQMLKQMWRTTFAPYHQALA